MFQKPEKMLVYLSYPIIDVGKEPDILVELVNHAPENWVFYRPFLPFQSQMEDAGFARRLEYFLGDDARKAFSQSKQTLPLLVENTTVSSIAAQCASYTLPTNCQAPILQHLSIMAISDLVICYCDTPNFHECGIELLWANLLKVPTLGVTNRFVTSPWIQTYTDALVTNSALLQEMDLRGWAIDMRRREFDFPVIVPKVEETTSSVAI